MSIIWNTGLAAERARHNLKLKNKKKKPQAASSKRQAASMEELDPTIDWNKLIDTLKTK
jgi:hypothetical protein